MKEPGVKFRRGGTAWEELIVINSMVFWKGEAASGSFSSLPERRSIAALHSAGTRTMLQPSYFLHKKKIKNQAAIATLIFLASSGLNENVLGISPTALGATEQLPPNLSKNPSQNPPGTPSSSDTSA